MHFLAPIFLAGLAGLFVPIVIHLIGRRRAKIVRFSAMDFLIASQKKVASRLRLRQLLLLLARLGAVCAIPLALARPFANGRADVPAAVARAQSAVLVIDDSASMRLRISGRTTLFDRAQARAHQILGLLGRDSDVAIVLGSEGGDAPLGELTQDRARASRTVDNLLPTSKAADLPLAVRRAVQILGTADHAERRIYVLTDGAAHAWDKTGIPSPRSGPELVVIDVSDGKTLPNHAVVGTEVAPAPEIGLRGVRITADIANFADTPEKDLQVTLRVDNKPVARGLVDVPAHGLARKTFHHAFPEGGYFDAAIQIPEDALGADDQRYLRIEVRKEVRVLLVDGDPRTVRRDDELFYLETALRPGDAAESQLSLSAVTTDTLPKKFGDWDVIFLCNAKAPTAAQAQALRAFVESGGGLFISAGDNVDPDAYQAAFGDLLPQPLKGARVVAPQKRVEGESGLENEGPAERLGRIDRRHPMFTVFPSDPVGLRSARFYRIMLLAPIPDTENRRAPLRFESGAPALVEAELGSGRVLLYTSTVDREWTDLPIRPGFLPLVQQAARYLARAPMREPEPPGVVGRPHMLPVASDDARIEVTTPSGAHKLFDRPELAGRRELPYADTGEPGIYHVAVAGVDGSLAPRPALGFAINLDPKESDLAKVRAGTSAGEVPTVAAATEAPTRRIELWHAVAAALLAFLVVEGLITRRA